MEKGKTWKVRPRIETHNDFFPSILFFWKTLVTIGGFCPSILVVNNFDHHVFVFIIISHRVYNYLKNEKKEMEKKRQEKSRKKSFKLSFLDLQKG